MLLIAISIITTISSNDKKEIQKDIKLYEVDKKQFSIYIENEEGKYSEYTNSNIFPEGYKVNISKSNCVDTKGNKLDGILSGTSNSVTVTSNKTTYCYIYFDIDYVLSELCSNGDKLGSCLTTNNEEIDSLDDTAYAEMYRYTGTNEIVDDNYICFGTTDKNECVNNPETYMYRIIGVTSEDNATLGLAKNQVKLIKDTSIGAHEWHSDYTTDTKWEDSSMYTYLQNDVLNNKTYIPNGWSQKISVVKWNIGDVNAYSSAQEVYELENNLTTSNISKIGLAYLSDYEYAYNDGNEIFCGKSVCTNWITSSLNNNWTMTRCKEIGYYAWGMRTDGGIPKYTLEDVVGVRPVFYLDTDEQYISGDGTIDNPIIIREEAYQTILKKDTEQDIGLQQTIIDGDDLYRFSGINGNVGINNYICLGTTSKCSSGSDNMYRIIGVNPNNGEIKVIKETPWNNSKGYAWNSNSDVTWLTSKLYTNTVLKIYDELSFKNMIVTNHVWNVGKVYSLDTETRTSVIEYENDISGEATIGIISLTDYYLAYNGDRNWNYEYDTTTNWIGGYSNGNVLINEWTMTYYGLYNNDYYCARNINVFEGAIGRTYLDSARVIRPTFYLKNNIYITNPEATGTSTDPYIIN